MEEGKSMENGATAPQAPTTPQVDSQENAVLAYRQIQAERDRVAAENARIKAQLAQKETTLKRYMNDEEREKYELAELASQERAKREGLELTLKQKESQEMKSKILQENPDLEVFAEDLDLSGMTEKQALEYVKATKKKLSAYVEKVNSIKKSEEPVNTPSLKTSSSTPGTITEQEFAKLPRAERIKYLQSQGAY